MFNPLKTERYSKKRKIF